MKTPYSSVENADTDSALLTNAAGYDVAVLERATLRAPGLPEEHHLSIYEWQGIINLVDAAPAMLEALESLCAYASGKLPHLSQVPEYVNAREIINRLTKP